VRLYCTFLAAKNVRKYFSVHVYVPLHTYILTYIHTYLLTYLLGSVKLFEVSFSHNLLLLYTIHVLNFVMKRLQFATLFTIPKTVDFPTPNSAAVMRKLYFLANSHIVNLSSMERTIRFLFRDSICGVRLTDVYG